MNFTLIVNVWNVKSIEYHEMKEGKKKHGRDGKNMYLYWKRMHSGSFCTELLYCIYIYINVV